VRRTGGSRLPDAEFRDLVDRARDRHLLSDIVGRHTKLERRGSQEKVGLCPFHSERTPSFEVNDGKGTYHCHGCGAGGNHYTFLMRHDGMTFRAAYEALSGEEFPVVPEEERVKRKAEDEAMMAARINLAREKWAASVPAEGTPAAVYARSRGITIDLPDDVRFVMTPRWHNMETGECGRDVPAMICALLDVSDDVVGVQCIFLEDGGRRKYERRRADGREAPSKITYGKARGAALRLGPVAECIVLCEGPEDGLTLMQMLPERSVWVSCGTGNLGKIQFPSEVRALVIAGDNGDAGRRASDKSRVAYACLGLSVEQTFPPHDFKDWNDQLRGLRL